MTPLEEAKYIQRCRVAAKYFFRFCNSLKISRVEYPYYDLFIEDGQTGLSFGVKVIDENYLESEDYNLNYLPLLKGIDDFNYSPRVPIALFNVNEVTETGKCGIILSLDWNGAKINYPTFMKDLNDKSHFERMMNELNMSDYMVRSLRDDSLGVLKTLLLKLPIRYGSSPEREAFAKIAYRRSFTKNYKLNSPKVVSREEQFKRFMNGIPQNEYPNDYLDEVIVRSISTKFDIVDNKSSLFLFNTELKDLKLEYRGKARKDIIIQTEPILDDKAIELLGSLISCPRINLTLFIENPFFKNEFHDEFINDVIDLNAWKQAYATITQLMPTLTDISKIID